MKIRQFLARLVATITNTPRYFPAEKWENLEWSNGQLYTHDFFRALEWVFGRRAGVRQEVSFEFQGLAQKVTYHTFESNCWKIETDFREGLKKILEPVRIASVQLAGTPFSFPAGVFAAIIAESSNANTNSSTSLNIALTVGGSGRIVIMGRSNYNPSTPGWTFTGGAITALHSSNKTVNGYTYNPSSGAQTLQVTSNSSSFQVGIGAVFSGASSMGNTNGNTGGAGSRSVTVSVAGSSNVVGIINTDTFGGIPSDITPNQTTVVNTGHYARISMNNTPGDGVISFGVSGSSITTVLSAIECKAPTTSMLFGFFGAMAGSPA